MSSNLECSICLGNNKSSKKPLSESISNKRENMILVDREIYLPVDFRCQKFKTYILIIHSGCS